MKKIPVSDILRLDGLENYKLHVARASGMTQPLDVFVDNRNEWFDWNRYRRFKCEFNRQHIFSLIDFYPETDMWLFGGIFTVLEREGTPDSLSYTIEENLEFAGYVGRLKIHFVGPRRGRSFYLEGQYAKMTVSEILKESYSGQVFPGLRNICFDFNILHPIFIQGRLDWKYPLMNVKGVYLIVDKLTGKLYVGSAYGVQGIWSRWCEYLDNGHGGNVELVKLIAAKGVEYAFKNFRLTLIESMPMDALDCEIVERESFWKGAVCSRGGLGYNKN